MSDANDKDASDAGQVSEGGSLDDTGTVFPEDAVAGYPLDDDEGADGIQEGAAGPNARTGDEDPDAPVRRDRTEEDSR